MSWGGLNPALTAFRDAVMARFPHKDTASDGARADAAHGSSSQHQPDPDGTTDAYDCDDDLRHPNVPAGGRLEGALQAAIKVDFENDPHGRSQLWIHNRMIANRSVGDWRERDYHGPNPHDKHFHFESRQARERDGRPWPMPVTDALLRQIEEGEQVDIEEFFASVARGVNGVDGQPAPKRDRDNRDNFADALRFALGTEGDQQAGRTVTDLLEIIAVNTTPAAPGQG